MTSKYYRKNGQPFDTPFRIERGLDGDTYAVFAHEFDADDFARDVLGAPHAPLVCFGGFLNAVRLGADANADLLYALEQAPATSQEGHA